MIAEDNTLMLTRTPWTRCAWAVLLATLLVPLAQAASIELAHDGRVTAVTLYPSQAVVTREIPLDGEPGDILLRVGGLPASLRPGTLHVSPGDAVQVRDIRPLRARAADPGASVRARLSAVDEAIAANAVQRDALQDRAATLERLDSYTTHAAAAELRRGALDPQTLERLALFSFAQQRGMTDVLIALQREARELQSSRRERLAELRELEATETMPGYQAELRIHKSVAGAHNLRLHYTVGDAGWRPAYRVHARSDAGDVDVEQLAEVRQASGEDWVDVALTVSSSLPASRADVAPLKPLRVELRKGPSAGTEQRGSRAQQLLELNTEASGPNRATRVAIALDTGFERSLATSSSVYDETPAQRVSLARLRLGGRVMHRAAPVRDTAVYREARVTNDTGSVLPAGQARVRFNGRDVGIARLERTLPGETLRVGLGVDPLVRAVRTVKGRDARTTGNRRMIEMDYRIEVVNGNAGAIDLELLDRLPTAPQRSGLEILEIDLSRPLSTNAAYLANEHTVGLLRWDVPLPPTPLTEPWQMDYGYQVSIDRSFHLALDRASEAGSARARADQTGGDGQRWLLTD